MTNSGQRVSTIAVFGESHELWPVATLLAQNLPPQMRLILVEHSGAAAVPAALTLACDSRFHTGAGIDVEQLLNRSNAHFGLGTDLQGWQGDDSSLFAAPSGTLPAINGIALHHVMLRAAMTYEEPGRLAHLLQPFRFAARTARAGKFAFPPDDPESPLGMLGPTIHIDRVDYTAFLKERFAADAEIRQARPVGISMDGPAIGSIRPDTGQDIAADFFVDVSGGVADLLPDEQRPGFTSLPGLMPFDRIASASTDRESGEGHGQTVARAMHGGLLIKTPLGSGCISELLFASDRFPDGTAQQWLGSDAPSAPFAPGFAETPWTANLARLGRASASLGPYQSADMILLHDQALHLIETLPASRQMDVEAASYNAKHLTSARQLRDFTLLPFVLNSRNDAPWAAIREAPLPETLQIRIDQFESRGRFVTFDNELFDRQTWIDMMIGFGIVPDRYDPMTDTLDMKRVAPVLKRMVDMFTAAIESMPENQQAGI
ncbi:MAG: hypothetical protein HKN78_04400 [Sphingomonadaceae bacterium]|nr:hypothetical protein [Sphingomonadaceae bacterium]